MNTGVILALLGIAATIIVALIVYLLQEKRPALDAECRTLEDADPSILECVVRNTGRGPAREVHVSFNNMLLLDTRVQAPPELGASVIEAEVLPDPNANLDSALQQMAFAVRIPRIAPRDSVVFRVTTKDPDNIRAARQVCKIRATIRIILRDFGERLAKTRPEVAEAWDYDLVMRARAKGENFFTPGVVSYEEGKVPLAYLTEKEQSASAVQSDLYRRYKRECIDVFLNRPQFEAPVVRIKSPGGATTYAILPPYVSSSVNAAVPASQAKAMGGVVAKPLVPNRYDWEETPFLPEPNQKPD